jgi:hypothetical protein
MKNKYETKDGKIIKGKDLEWFREQQRIRDAENPYVDERGICHVKTDCGKAAEYANESLRLKYLDLEKISKEAREKILKDLRAIEKRYNGELGNFD